MQILSFILGICMMGTTSMTQEGIQSLKGALFTMVAENFFPPMYGVIAHIPNKMPVFLREYTNYINTPLIFYLSNVISLVKRIIFSIVILYTNRIINRSFNELFAGSRIFGRFRFLRHFNVCIDRITKQLVRFYMDCLRQCSGNQYIIRLW